MFLVLLISPLRFLKGTFSDSKTIGRSMMISRIRYIWAGTLLCKLMIQQRILLLRVLKEWKQTLSSLKEIISNVKLVLTFINFLDEFRDLSLVEWNFRKLMEAKLISLSKQQKTYWKQRGAIKWVTLGDASTKFFHAQATIKYRRNLITQLQDEQGNILTDHSGKANLICLAFK